MTEPGSGGGHDAGLAALIDHTILKPDASEAEIVSFCEQAVSQGFRAVCVNPIHVALVASMLSGSGVRTCSVVGFPFGATTARIKASEAAGAIEDGADEIDMVIAIGALREGRHEIVRDEIRAVRAATRGKVLKVIIEAAMLDEAAKLAACRLAAEGEADFVKTSTGYGGGGATAADVTLMRRAVGPAIGVKASGGIRTREAVEAMVAAGATRIGSSSGLAIVGAGAPSGGTY